MFTCHSIGCFPLCLWLEEYNTAYSWKCCRRMDSTCSFFRGRRIKVKVVIVGDRSRESPQDVVLVNTILDYCKEKYPKLRVVTKGVDRGVGKMIKTRLTDPITRRPREIDWMEVNLQHHLIGEDIPKMEFSSDYDALNAVLVELGDEFHILSEERPRGV